MNGSESILRGPACPKKPPNTQLDPKYVFHCEGRRNDARGLKIDWPETTGWRTELNKTANKIAKKCGTRLSGKLGLDPILITGIISSLLQIFAACKKKEEPDVTPADFLASKYNSDTGEFDPALIKRARPQARRAARKNGQKGLDKDALDALSVEAFTQTMNEKDQGAVSLACMQLADSDEE